MPKVSVIIPTYNRAKYVAKAIDSVLAQTYRDYEIIVVDDGSTDNTREILKTYTYRIHYIYQENSGVSAARNTGIQKAKGEWIAFLDSDDEWLPNKLAVQIEDISKESNVFLHATNAVMWEESGDSVDMFSFTGALKYFSRGYEVVERPLSLVYQINNSLARIPCVLVRREQLIAAGMFDPKLTIFEDHYLMCKLAIRGRWCINMAKPVYIHRRNELTANLSMQVETHPIMTIQALVYLYEKLYETDGMTEREKEIIANQIRKYKSQLGMVLLRNGDRLSSHSILRQVIVEKFSLKALLKYLLSAPGVPGVFIRFAMTTSEFLRRVVRMSKSYASNLCNKLKNAGC